MTGPWEKYRTQAPIDTSRPRLQNRDGSFSTERTIGIEMDGRHYNIPTIVDGQQRTPQEAVDLFRQGRNPAVGEYATQQQADTAAPQRSEQIGRVRGPWEKYGAGPAPNVGGLPPEASPVEYARDSASAAAQASRAARPPPVQRSMGQHLLEAERNIHLAARQRTDPAVYDGERPLRRRLGAMTPADSDVGPGYYVTPDGNFEPFDSQKHVALVDPDTGHTTAYERNTTATGLDQTEESTLKSAGRIITGGLVTAPIAATAKAAQAAWNAQRAATVTERAQAATRDLEAFNRADVPVFPPAFGGTATRATAKGLSETFGVGAPLQSGIEDTYRGVRDAAQRAAGNYGASSTAREAGQVVERGLERFKDARPADVVEDGIRQLPDGRLNEIIASPARSTSLKAKQGALYERAWRMIPQEMQRGRAVEGLTRVMQGPENTRAVLQDIQGRNARMTIQSGQNAAPEAVTRPVQGGLLGRMIEAISNPRWTANLQTLRDMRSEFRRLASGMSDTERNTLRLSDLDRIQSAITQDMVALLARNATAYREAGDVQTALGFDRSIREFHRADRFTRLSMERLQTVERLFRAESAESLARNIMTAATSGTRGNFDMLRTLHRTLQPEEMAEVAASVISEMGRPVASAGGVVEELGFSVNSFMSKWNGMSPEARNVLFGGEHLAALDDVVSVAGRLANVERMANTSGSGRMAMNVGGALTGMGALATGGWPAALTAAAGGYGVSLLLSRPVTARWLVGYLNLRARASQSGRAVSGRLATHINQLGQIAEREPALLPLYRSLAEDVGVIEGDEKEKRNDEGVGIVDPEGGPEGELSPPIHQSLNSMNAMRMAYPRRDFNAMAGGR